MRKTIAATFIIASLAVSGCYRQEGGEAHGKGDSAAIVAAIRAQESALGRAYAARDAAAIAAMYAPDAVLANPGASLLTGSSIRPAIDQFATDTNLALQFRADRIQVAGDLAYSRGPFTMRMTDPATGRPRYDRGHYLTVWQRQQDGRWLMVEDFIVNGPAGQAGDAPPIAAPPATAPATNGPVSTPTS